MFDFKNTRMKILTIALVGIFLSVFLWSPLSNAYKSIRQAHYDRNKLNEEVSYEFAFRNHELVKNPANIGTYNFIAPRGFWGSIGHFFADVLPYWMWGNTPDDATPFWNRVTGP